ncbi:hypothetical protein CDAR_288841 [Caerostris darwini]|uniref:Uncharacterized protein n=1 Tax=Caerostris darwini TaxID=1538125 RepID=A0AAV4QT10_9ARAC|nr:hypothetical protein CDAR_288841 [Caerostris darwini]
MESMDITTDTSPDNLTTVFPAITETVVDISIRSALHYLHYKEILMAAEDILQQSIPAEFHTACLTFGQLQSLREHARTFITVQDILTSLINHTRTETNPTAAGHPMLTKTRQSLTDLQQDLTVWVGNLIQYLTSDQFIPAYTENTNFNIFDHFTFKSVLPYTTIPRNTASKRRHQSAAKANTKHTTAEIALQNSFAVLSDTDSDATPH